MVLKNDPVGIDYPKSEKDKINMKAIKLISQKTAELVNEGDNIMVDSGTTVMELVKYFDKRVELTIITNALNIANQLSKTITYRLSFLAGFLDINLVHWLV